MPQIAKRNFVQNRLVDHRQGSLLFVFCWLSYFASYIGRYNYSAAMGALMDDGVLSVSVAGAVSTAYFLCYSAGQMVNGFLSMRISPYSMVFVGLFCSGLSNVFMGIAPPSLMLFVWACNGFFQSMLWPPLVRVFSEVLPDSQQKMACVNITSTTPAGTLVSFALSAGALAIASWNGVFWICGLIMIAFALLWLVTTLRYRTLTRPEPVMQCGNSEKAATEVSDRATPKLSLPRLFLVSGLLWLLLPVALHGALKDGMTSWVPAFVQNTFAVTPSFSVVLSMVLPVVNLSGAYLAMWMDKHWFRNEVKTAAALFLLACGALAVLPFVFRASMLLSMVLLAVTTSAMLGVNTLLIGIIPVKAGRGGNAAAISGVLNAITYGGAALSTWGSGLIIEHFGWLPAVILWLCFAVVATVLCCKPIRQWAKFVG